MFTNFVNSRFMLINRCVKMGSLTNLLSSTCVLSFSTWLSHNSLSLSLISKNKYFILVCSLLGYF